MTTLSQDDDTLFGDENKTTYNNLLFNKILFQKIVRIRITN